MIKPIFIDTNIVLYATSSRPETKSLKISCQKILQAISERKLTGITDVMVFEEILHAGRRLKKIKDCLAVFDEFNIIMEYPLPINKEDLNIFRKLYQKYGVSVEALDCLHTAVMMNHNIETICTRDKDFDIIKEVKRIDPVNLAKELKKKR